MPTLDNKPTILDLGPTTLGQARPVSFFRLRRRQAHTQTSSSRSSSITTLPPAHSATSQSQSREGALALLERANPGRASRWSFSPSALAWPGWLDPNQTLLRGRKSQDPNTHPPSEAQRTGDTGGPRTTNHTDLLFPQVASQVPAASSRPSAPAPPCSLLFPHPIHTWHPNQECTNTDKRTGAHDGRERKEKKNSALPDVSCCSFNTARSRVQALGSPPPPPRPHPPPYPSSPARKGQGCPPRPKSIIGNGEYQVHKHKSTAKTVPHVGTFIKASIPAAFGLCRSSALRSDNAISTPYTLIWPRTKAEKQHQSYQQHRQ